MVGVTQHLTSGRGLTSRATALLASLFLFAGCGSSFSSDGDTQAMEGDAGTAGEGAGSAGTGAAGGGGTAGVSSGGGTAGAPGGSGGSNDGERCPNGRGPEMIEAGDLCVDSTEVTNAHYAEFLADETFVAEPPTECDWNDTFVQDRDGPTEANANHPVVQVDWCDAHAFCQWAEKRLCGRVGGGATPWTGHAKAEQSEWFAACSHGGETVFPYGDDYDEFKCSGRDASGFLGPPVPVDEFVDCVGGFAGLRHMSGNVGEWENSCGGFPIGCRVRGGSSVSNSGGLQCNATAGLARDARDSWTGIRCCAD